MGTFVQQLGPARGVAVLSRKCTPHASRAHFTPQRMRVAAAARTNSSAADERDQQMAVTSLLASLAGGAVGGLFGPFDEALPLAVQHVSSSLGWAYFLAWSISFYPQASHAFLCNTTCSSHHMALGWLQSMTTHSFGRCRSAQWNSNLVLALRIAGWLV
jgi:hypothetical protein